VSAVPLVLNVGGNSKLAPMPPHYDGWEKVILDIDPRAGVDVVCDARELTRLAAGDYDAIFCSHNLEHYWRHDLPRVLAGFLHVLKPDGFAEIWVPDMLAVFRETLERDLDPDDVIYHSALGPITVNDVVYGYGPEIESSGQDFFAHKNGFSERSLKGTLIEAGFGPVYTALTPREVRALAFRRMPTAEQRRRLLSGPT
jgi:SAM-dependent methyltransferase